MGKGVLIVLSLVLGLVLALFLPAAQAGTVVANSASWENVYSAGVFATLEGHNFFFLISPQHSQSLAEQMDSKDETFVVESDRVPYVKNYAKRLKQEGFTTSTLEIGEESGNLDIASRVSTKNFVVVDASYGYNAISITPWAVHNNMYVLFADKQNTDEVKDFLSTQGVNKIVLFGDLDKEVKEALAPFNPEIINEGGRFTNAIEAAERYRAQSNARQVILTNGEFLERDIFSAGKNSQPIVFIGKDRPPQEVIDYLQIGGYKAGVVLGNDLIGSVQAIKDTVGLPIFIKFGKGTTNSGGFKSVEGLDIFPLPLVELLLSLQGVFYNVDTQQVELIVKNEEAAKTYLTTSLLVHRDDTPIITLGDEDAQQIEDFEIKGLVYDAQIDDATDLSVDLFVPYGISERELDKSISITLPLQIISEGDSCEVDVSHADYDAQAKRIVISARSDGDCYAEATLRNIIVSNKKITATSEVEHIRGSGTIIVPQELSKVDISDNPALKVVLRYGSRQFVLNKVKEVEIPLSSSGVIGKIVVIALLVLAFALGILLWKRNQQPKKEAPPKQPTRRRPTRRGHSRRSRS